MNKIILIACSVIHVSLYASENSVSLPLLPRELIALIFTYTLEEIRPDDRISIDWHAVHRAKGTKQSLSLTSHYWSSFSNTIPNERLASQPTSLPALIVCDKTNTLRAILLCNAPEKKDALFELFKSLCKSDDLTQIKHAISLFKNAQFRFNKSSILFEQLPQLHRDFQKIGISAPAKTIYHYPLAYHLIKIPDRWMCGIRYR